MSEKEIIIPVGSKKNVARTEFVGSPFYNIVGMYFLSHKHDNVCVIWGQPYTPDKSKNPILKVPHIHSKNCVLLPSSISKIPDSHIEVSLRWIEKDGYISVPKPETKFWENFEGCIQSKKRFIVLPFGFNCLDSGHQNYLLYDKDNHTLRRFETFGDVDTECLSDENIDKSINDLFTKNVKSFKNYIKPLKFLPKNSFQTIQENEKKLKSEDPVGFCSVWSIWLIDLCLSNPDFPIPEIIKMSMDWLKQKRKEGYITFTSFIRDYSIELVKLGKEIKEVYNNDGFILKESILDGSKRRIKNYLLKKRKSTSKCIMIKNKYRSRRNFRSKKKKRKSTNNYRRINYIKNEDFIRK
jgi:hypothetical protein